MNTSIKQPLSLFYNGGHALYNTPDIDACRLLRPLFTSERLRIKEPVTEKVIDIKPALPYIPGAS